MLTTARIRPFHLPRSKSGCREVTRGAFWRSEVVFDVVIWVPPGVVTRINVMDPRE
jgi:hypothetical protein